MRSVDEKGDEKCYAVSKFSFVLPIDHSRILTVRTYHV